MRLPLVTTAKDSLMMHDINGALVSLNFYVETPDEIEFKTYDVTVTHDKAVYIIRMMMFALTQETFEKGVRYYLQERAYNSATPRDLHAGLQRAHHEDFPGINLDIEAVMYSWEMFAGYPIVTVRRDGQRLIFTQQGFRTSHDEIFSIPIAFATATNSNFDDAADFWMTTRETEILQSNASKSWSDGDWIVLNLRNYGYYITNYDDNLWSLIIDQLTSDIESIHFENRGLLFADFHKLIDQGHDVSSTIFLRLAMSLQLENEVNVWDRAHPGLLRISNRLRGTVLLEDHLSYLRHVMTPIYDRLLNDENFDSEILGHVSFWSCRSGVSRCLVNALNEVVTSMENNSVTSEMCLGFMTANETVWMHFWDVALRSSETARQQLLNDLPCTSNNELLNIYLNASLDTSNGLTQEDRVIIINRVFSANFIGYDLIYEFIRDNQDFIHSE